MKVSVGNILKFTAPGSGSAAGAKYQVYYISGTAKNVPTTESIAYLKLIEKAFYQVGVPFITSVPVSELDQFFTNESKH